VLSLKIFFGCFGNPGSKFFADADDYKKDSKPVEPEIFLYNLLLEFVHFCAHSFKLAESTFNLRRFLLILSVAPVSISRDLKSVLKPRIRRADRENYIETIVDNKGFLTVDSDLPDTHKQANIIGVPMFFYLGIGFTCSGVGSFQFDVKISLAMLVLLRSFLTSQF
jgi:hypothetical protein